MTKRLPRLVGMVHLLPLPGSPRYAGSMDEVVGTAVEDARILVEGGFPALMVENFGDAPFYAEVVPPETVAGMAIATSAVRQSGVPVGVNVLRNDAIAALGVAAVTGAEFIRVNVLTGVMYTDQGAITGRAAEVLRRRATLCPQVEIWADVLVKHATPPHGVDAGLAAEDTVKRGLADALIISGPGTGVHPDLAEAKLIRDAAPPGTRLVIGSGADLENLDQLTVAVDTIIVGSSVKAEGDARNRPDPSRVADFVARAGQRGLL